MLSEYPQAWRHISTCVHPTDVQGGEGEWSAVAGSAREC